MTALLAATALAYARAGIPVVPVNRQKKPYFRGWLDAATTDASQIERWWFQYPIANIAAPTGRRSGFFVLDIDPRNGGDDELANLMVEHGTLPTTLTSATGGGGWHHYFELPEFRVRSCEIAPGVEVLGERKAVTLPPSVHASGRAYRWSGTQRSRARAPVWLLDRVRPPSPRCAPMQPVEISDAYVRAAVEGECASLCSTAEGGRNRQLNASAFSLGTLVGAGALASNAAASALLQAAEASGLSRREATGTIHSGLRAGMKHPRALSAVGSRP